MKQHVPKNPDQMPVQQPQPGKQMEMDKQPSFTAPWYNGSAKLAGKVAIITGGDSGIGKSVAVLFAREGAKVVISYLEEHEDAQDTQYFVEQEGGECLVIPGDIGSSEHCESIVQQTLKKFGAIDIVVNNAAAQFPQQSLIDISDDQLEQTFRTNIFSQFYLTRAALPHLKEGSTIINTTSVTAYRGSGGLLDYSSTKGAIVTFTRSLAQQLGGQKIRVNAVAPGPIWTPLITSTFPKEKVDSFGKDTLMGRPGQPDEVAPCYVFLASQDSSYITGQVLHPNGGEIING